MAWLWGSKDNELEQAKSAFNNELNTAIERLAANNAEAQSIRARIAQAVSGGYDFADTLHNIFLDYGYPNTVTFPMLWNMYRRFGIAKNAVELPVEYTWISKPIIEGDGAFVSELEKLDKMTSLYKRITGLDKRQRVGRYAGMFMRVRDGLDPSKPIEGTLSGVNSIVDMIPLYEGELEVLTTDTDPNSDDYNKPKTYQYSSGATGNRNEKSQSSFIIHASRIVIAAEDADNGGIYGVPALESAYNSLMDLRKIIGGGAEGFYKNASQNVVFELKDAASAAQNAELLQKFNEQYDDFAQNRMRKALWTPALEPKTLNSTLVNPKDFFTNALNDVAAGVKIPATILIGQQTGRLASTEDGRVLLSRVNSRRENFGNELISSILDWCIEWGILPASEYKIEWDDLLALSDQEKLDNATKMASVNQSQFQSGGDRPFTSEEIRIAAGFEELSEFDDDEGELLDGEEDEG